MNYNQLLLLSSSQSNIEHEFSLTVKPEALFILKEQWEKVFPLFTLQMS